MVGRANRVPALDGVRGLAIALVLLWHGLFSTGAYANHPLASRIMSLGRLSWSGVDLFFVLSGFLIGGNLLDTAESKRYFSTFYMRRVHRIAPLYAAVLAFVFLAPFAMRNLGVTGISNRIPLPYYLAFLQNLWMAKNGSFGSNILGVTWSLAVEEQFYLTLPFTIRYVPRSRLWWIVTGMIVGAPLVRMLLNHTGTTGTFASYVLLLSRADALGLGVATALVVRSPKVWEKVASKRKYVYAALGVTVLAVVAMLLSGFTAFTNEALGLEYLLLACLYSLLLLATLLNRHLDAVFSTRTLRYLGTIAYGLYLLHYGCIWVVHGIARRLCQEQSGWMVLSVPVAGIAMAMVLATLSWEYLEKPLIKWGHRYRYDGNSDQPKVLTPRLDVRKPYTPLVTPDQRGQVQPAGTIA
jgi:peptidoglycan/LPS O-acetylase OafA/YrhL